MATSAVGTILAFPSRTMSGYRRTERTERIRCHLGGIFLEESNDDVEEGQGRNDCTFNVRADPITHTHG